MADTWPQPSHRYRRNVTSSVWAAGRALVGQTPGHGVPQGRFTAAAVTPTAGFDDTAREGCALGLMALAGDDEPKLVEAAEGCQIGVGERIYALTDAGVGHVAVLSG
jgi:hypothetical protein